MKKTLLIAAMSVACMGAKAQGVIVDTVYMGGGYANQVFYSLPDDETGTSAKNNWDLGFKTGGFSSDILVNTSGTGAIWLYPKSDKSGWSAVDTAGLSKWSKGYNAETEWMGALGRYLDPAIVDGTDLGWGKYDMTTHIVSGDSIYIVKTQAGNFRKLIINKLTSATYTFTYANLDGSDSTTSTLSKATYTGKNRGYFSLDTKTAIDREPMTTAWDMTFCQYATADYASAGMPGYTVTGILVNDTVKVALAKVQPSLRAGYTSYAAHTFGDNINGIGYNWKTYDMTGGVYKLNDSSVYFVKRNNGDIWKMIFTNFTSTDGGVYFSKQLIYTAGVSVKETAVANTTVVLSPNPVVGGQNISVVYNLDQRVEDAAVTVYDLSGRVIISSRLETAAGMHAFTFPTANLAAGTYVVNVIAGTEKSQQKFIVQ